MEENQNKGTIQKKKALFLYSSATGKEKKKKQLARILPRLEKLFDLTVHQDKTMEEGIALALDACGKCDALILFGGDGSLNHIANALAYKENAPALAYLPGGTLNDGGKNFGVSSIEKGLRIIEDGFISSIDLLKAGDTYCVYLAGFGAYMDVSYVAKRKTKKLYGKFIYYMICMKEMFFHRRYPICIEGEDSSFEGRVAIASFMNGRYIGGMQVNKKAKLNDGTIEALLVRPRLFNGFLSFVFHAGFVRLKGNHFKVAIPEGVEWCFDGEQGEKGSLELSVAHNAIKVYCDKNQLG